MKSFSAKKSALLIFPIVFLSLFLPGCKKRVANTAMPDPLPPNITSPIQQYLRAKDRELAIKKFDSGDIILDAYKKRGDIFFKQKQYDRAIAEYEGGLKLEGGQSLESLEVMKNLAFAHSVSGDPKKGSAYLIKFFDLLGASIQAMDQAQDKEKP